MPFPQKQTLFVPLGLGLQTDVDDKLLPVGKNLDLDNCQVERQQEVCKRYGMVAVAAPGNVQGALGTHQGALLDMGVPLETLAGPQSTQWTAADGDFRPGLTSGLVKVDGNAGQPDMAYGGGFYWIIYRVVQVHLGSLVNAGLAKCAAIDPVTGHVAWSGSMLPTSTNHFASWEVVYCNGKAVFVTVDSGNTLQTMVVDPTTFASATFTQAISNGGFADCIAQATVVSVGFVNVGGNMAGCDFNPLTHAFTLWAAQDSGAAPIPLDAAFGWMRDYGASGKLSAITSSAAQGTKVQWNFPTAGATRAAAITYVINAGVPGNVVAGHTASNSATGDFVVAYSIVDTTGAADFTYFTCRSGSTIASGGFAANVALVSKTWTANGENFCAVKRRSATNGTAFVVRIAYPFVVTLTDVPVPLAKIAVRSLTNDNNGALYSISSVANPAPGVFCFGLMYVVRFETTVAPESYGVEIAVVTHPGTLGITGNVGLAGQSTAGIPRESIGSTFLPGAFMGQYDGRRFAEAGFAWSPDAPGTPTPSAGGGLTASSTYWYVVVFARMDSQGRLWRSAPSLPFSGATGAGQGTLSIPLRTLGLTGRDGAGATGDGVYDVIELYRGAAGIENLLQRVGSIPNSTSVNTLAFADTMSDATLASQEFLYSNGNILENDTPPGFISTVEAQNRTWGISADDPQAVWPSKEHVLGTGLEFSEPLALDVRNSHGPGRAMAQVDDRPLVFKDDAIYAIGGQGPDAQGNGGSYAPQIVCAGIGCNNPRAICETRDGVVFRSTGQRAGFFLLDRGLSVTYIGAAVQRYDGESIRSALFSSLLLQARFMTASGRTLVYDLVTGIWTTFTGQPCATAVSWGGQPAYVSTATSHVLAEDLSGQILTDDGNTYEMRVSGPWLQAAQVKGYQRFNKQQLTGEVSGAAIQVGLKMYKDFGTVPLVSTVLAAPIGAIDAELRCATKLSAVKTVISDLGSTTGRLKVSGITYEIAVKQGLKRMNPSDRFTG